MSQNFSQIASQQLVKKVVNFSQPELRSVKQESQINLQLSSQQQSQAALISQNSHNDSGVIATKDIKQVILKKRKLDQLQIESALDEFDFSPQKSQTNRIDGGSTQKQLVTLNSKKQDFSQACAKSSTKQQILTQEDHLTAKNNQTPATVKKGSSLFKFGTMPKIMSQQSGSYNKNEGKKTSQSLAAKIGKKQENLSPLKTVKQQNEYQISQMRQIPPRSLAYRKRVLVGGSPFKHINSQESQQHNDAAKSQKGMESQPSSKQISFKVDVAQIFSQLSKPESKKQQLAEVLNSKKCAKVSTSDSPQKSSSSLTFKKVSNNSKEQKSKQSSSQCSSENLEKLQQALLESQESPIQNEQSLPKKVQIQTNQKPRSTTKNNTNFNYPPPPQQFQQPQSTRNANMVEKKRTRMKRALQNGGGSGMPTKNKFGQNMKKHFATWKYFLKANAGNKNTISSTGDQNSCQDERQKMYISAQCERLSGPQATAVAKRESKLNYRDLLKGVQQVGLRSKDPQSLEYWGLPQGLIDKIQNTGVKQLFKWQAECLGVSERVVQGNSNLIYFAPTSGGKSIVSEILMLRSILGQRKRAIYVLPYVSIVSEKTTYLTRLTEDLNFKIIGLHSQSEAVWTPNVDLAICTIEKANSLLNKLIEEQLYFDVEFFIIDEFHLVQDKQRGYLLETIIAKLKTIERIFKKPNAFQIVGMSATLGGLNTLKKWLDHTEVYQCNHRPVPLSEYTLDTQTGMMALEPPKKHRNEIADDVKSEEQKQAPKAKSQENLEDSPELKRQFTNLKQVCQLQLQQQQPLDKKQMQMSKYKKTPQTKVSTQTQSFPLLPKDSEFLATLSLAYLRKQKAVLIFCPTKDGCQKVAQNLAQQLPVQFPEYKDLLAQQEPGKRRSVNGKDQKPGDRLKTPPKTLSVTKNAQIKVEFTDLVSELKEIVENVGEIWRKGGKFERDKVFDKGLQKRRLLLLEELKQCPAGLCNILKDCVKYGVAYHHSGLTNDEKEIIERGYRQGVLFLLVATSTLSTGINLPAKAVIFKSPKIAQNLMDIAKYKQMSGRAGRTGFDTRGDAIMVCRDKGQLEYCRRELLKPFEAKLTSALNASRLVRSLLEIIASQVVQDITQIAIFIKSTLQFELTQTESCEKCEATKQMNDLIFEPKHIANQENGSSNSADIDQHLIQPEKNSLDQILEEENLTGSQQFKKFIDQFEIASFIKQHTRQNDPLSIAEENREEFNQNDEPEQFSVNYCCKNCMMEFVKQTIAYLQKKHFLIIQGDKILPTPLGKAAFASSIMPEESCQIFGDLLEARQDCGLVLESDLHLLYLLTPHFKNLKEPNWDAFIKIWKRLSKCEKAVAEIYGINRDYMEWARQIRPLLPDFITERPKQPNVYANKTRQNKSNQAEGQLGQQPGAQQDELSMMMCLKEHLEEKDLKLLKFCKFYMALMANEVLKETPVHDICEMFGNCSRGIVQTVQQQTMNYAGMMAAFCERLCWTDFSALFMRINEKINWQVKEELLDLMQISALRPDRARSLFRNGIESVESVAKTESPQDLVKIFMESDGFVSHRRSNTEDLTLKYAYLYSFASKVLSEAKAIQLKKKFDPNATRDNYLAQPNERIQAGAEYLLLSDQSSSNSSDSSDSDEDSKGAAEITDSDESLTEQDALLEGINLDEVVDVNDIQSEELDKEEKAQCNNSSLSESEEEIGIDEKELMEEGLNLLSDEEVD